MGILDKARELSVKVTDKAVEFSSDELIADIIIKAVIKQEKVNKILQDRGCNYRVNELDLEMGIPPTVVFGIHRVNENDSSITGEKENLTTR